MSRLYDRLMCEGKYEEYLNGMVVVAADDVVKYYHETSEQVKDVRKAYISGGWTLGHFWTPFSLSFAKNFSRRGKP